ncbi:putative bifunctional diguanylate cyclase/phosphodiesterase [Delftia tsuruhatensis]|uniref:putative bifunctional diguanylate cyclase/phosphodiesterase n=1 Tax=Delftia tsuruhatensis TaxID=180282 RepID=UPI001F245DCB|nr:EAL domain-containing protein [Delftia tsuruhatensis]
MWAWLLARPLAAAAADLPAESMPVGDEGFWSSYWEGLGRFGPVPVLIVFLVSSVLYLRMRNKAQRLTQSLQKTNEKLLRANVKLKRIAFRDPLTGIANRALLEYRLHRAIAQADSSVAGRPEGVPARVGLLFIDLDGFKPINDVEGHAAGDALLCQVAVRLSRMTRKADTLARVGGDEFVLLLGSLASVDDAVAMASRVQMAIGQPFDLPGKTVSISSSIGLALYPDHGHKDKLMAAADAAMYTAKRAGGNTYAIFEESMRQGIAAQFDLQQALRRAVANGELVLHYQPKIDTRTGRIRGVEALARWNHPRFGLISPRVFIPLAERFGLIGEIGDWVIDEACRQTAQWALQRRYMRVSINISGFQIFHSRLAQYIRGAIDKHGIRPEQLVFEITESVAMEDDKTTMAVIGELTGMGVQISIDDFGTGYSSLALLRQLCADEVKIDRSFVRDVALKSDARAVVDAIVRLAHALGLRVVAEGVATQQQRDVLEVLGCDELQGFYFARPMDAQALIASEIWTADGFEPVQFSRSSYIDNL